jgi:hypothetical protein
MRGNNKLLTVPLLLLICAGAGLQLRHWNESEWSGGRGAGQLLTTVGLVLLAIVAPRYTRPFFSSRRNKPVNFIVGVIVITGIAFLAWLLYNRYYGPLFRSVDDPSQLF